MRTAPVAGRSDLLVLFEGDHPPHEQVAELVARLDAEPDLDAVGRGKPVTDAIKEVDGDGRVTRSLDRSKLVTLGSPTVVRRTVWEARETGAIGLL